MKRRGLIFGAGFVLVVAGIALVLFRPESVINKQNFNRIEVGQSETEVETILGGAARDDAPIPRVLFSEDGLEGVVFVEGAVTSRMLGTPGKVWASDGGIVVVVFDGNGRVTEKVFYPARPKNERIVDRIQRWLGI